MPIIYVKYESISTIYPTLCAALHYQSISTTACCVWLSITIASLLLHAVRGCCHIHNSKISYPDCALIFCTILNLDSEKPVAEKLCLYFFSCTTRAARFLKRFVARLPGLKSL